MKIIYTHKLQKTWVLSTIKDKDSLPATSDIIPPSCIEISKLLLEIDGTDVCLYHHEEWSNSFFAQTCTLFAGKVKRKEMGEKQCHENSALLLISAPDKYKLITGFCLNRGMWRRHTWLLDKKEQIIETTTIREKYVGVELKNNMEEKMRFLFNYLGSDYMETLPRQKFLSLFDIELITQIAAKVNSLETSKQNLEQTKNK
jgi:hypothetical protein